MHLEYGTVEEEQGAVVHPVTTTTMSIRRIFNQPLCQSTYPTVIHLGATEATTTPSSAISCRLPKYTEDEPSVTTISHGQTNSLSYWEEPYSSLLSACLEYGCQPVPSKRQLLASIL